MDISVVAACFCSQVAGPLSLAAAATKTLHNQESGVCPCPHCGYRSVQDDQALRSLWLWLWLVTFWLAAFTLRCPSRQIKV